jgi:glycosyltransferase involved in cell wall biosynthesis
MRILHVTPHLPPDQAANALLPAHLGAWARDRGDLPSFVAHPPRTRLGPGAAAPPLPGRVVWVAPYRPARALDRVLKVSALSAAIRIIRAAAPAVAEADLVHIHSNGLLAELCALLASVRRKPCVLTLYGTEIWHYRPKRIPPDLFTRAYRKAAVVIFYSHGLKDRAVELGLDRSDLTVIYPPVAAEFQWQGEEGHAEARARLGIRCRRLLVNVKRLHPLAGQRFLIDAMPDIVHAVPDTHLVICGTGPLLGDLRARARELGVADQITFAGLVENARVAEFDAAADLFVLPSLLEACPTVAIEALACGTPVISTDNPGGVELARLFGADISVVPRENVRALAEATIGALATPRRAFPATRAIVEREFGPKAVADRYYRAYRRALGTSDEATRMRMNDHGID